MFNYLDGIPVKISERFKPPPKVSIPQAIINRLNISENYIDLPQYTYDFTLETSVRSKMDQWRRVRETERENRKERIRKYELNKARSLEIKQKQLLTAVSYPNAEELSSDEEKELDKCAMEEQNKSHSSDKQQKSFQISNGVLKPSELWSDTILMPTVVPNDLQSSYTPVLQNYPSTTKCSNSKINYSDFENIESSPFDNIELKTINELDVLAQVLNITQIHSNYKTTIGENDNCKDEIQNIRIVSNEKSAVKDENPLQMDMKNISTDKYSENIAATDNVEQFASGVKVNNHNSTIITIIPTLPINSHDSQTTSVSQQQQNTPQQLFQNYENMNLEVSENSTGFYYNYSNNTATSNQNYYNFSYNYQPNQSQINQIQHLPQTSQNVVSQGLSYNQCNYTNNQGYLTSSHQSDFSPNLSYDVNEIYDSHNKSKSVPDICKELNKDIRDSEARRVRNHSQTMEDHNDKINKRDIADNVARSKNKKHNSSKTFMKLSPSSQILAENISSMGFPLERVSKIAAKYGNDDKKIVEHLIPLSELLDLGFDETKTSEALIKFDNNKEKALDFLISL